MELKKPLISHRRGLLSDPTQFIMNDLGSGSKVFKGNKRRVNKVARVAGMSKSDQLRLMAMCRHLKPQSILELGTSMGLGTAALCLANPVAKITSIEGCANTLAMAEKHLAPLAHPKLNLLNNRFDGFLEQDQSTFELIYLDGDHGAEQTWRYFENLLPKLTEDGLLLIDDIHWSKGMQNTWNRIVADPRINVSIDCYSWGMVCIRPGQRKQHFNLRM